MLFKKLTDGLLKVTDINPPFEIGHQYFEFKESDYPFDSLMFKRYLEGGQIVVLSIEDGCKRKDYFSKFLWKDEKLEEHIKVEEKKHEDRQKEEEKKIAKEQRKKEREAKKLAEKKAEEEKRKAENVIIIKDEDIEENVAKHLLG